MGALSNFLRRFDSPSGAPSAAPPAAQARPVYPGEESAALRLVIGSLAHPADDQALTDFLLFVQSKKIDLSEIWVVQSGNSLCWAALPILSEGRTMLLLTPGDVPPAHAQAAIGVMLDGLCQRYSTRNVQLAQALIDPHDEASRRVFQAHGFVRMAELIYLHTAIRRPPAPPPLPAGITVSTYSDQTHPLFAEAILASYRDSLDCPGLNGVRKIEDIIAGHKACGEFDPKMWFLLCQQNESGQSQPRGVLLLSRLPRGDTVELVYLGLAPEARGLRLGDWLMRCALVSTASAGLPRLSLAVDSLNAPALRLYYRFGLSRLASKVAMMRTLGS